MEEILGLPALLKKLEESAVPRSYYRIGSYREEALCMLFENDQWIVFEAERGQRYNTHAFAAESDACTYFWDRIQAFL